MAGRESTVDGKYFGFLWVCFPISCFILCNRPFCLNSFLQDFFLQRIKIVDYSLVVFSSLQSVTSAVASSVLTTWCGRCVVWLHRPKSWRKCFVRLCAELLSPGAPSLPVLLALLAGSSHIALCLSQHRLQPVGRKLLSGSASATCFSACLQLCLLVPFSSLLCGSPSWVDRWTPTILPSVYGSCLLSDSVTRGC